MAALDRFFKALRIASSTDLPHNPLDSPAGNPLHHFVLTSDITMREPTIRPYYDLTFADVKGATTTQSPTEAGYDGKISEVFHPREKQNTYAQLYFARFFHISIYHMVVCVGIDRFCSTGRDSGGDFRSFRDRISRCVTSMQTKTFGVGSFVSKLAEHIISVHDFKAHVFNLAGLEHLAGMDPGKETAEQQATRLEKKKKCQELREYILHKYHDSLAAAERQAEDELSKAEADQEKKRASQSESADTFAVKRAKANLKFRQELNQPWAPDDLASYQSPKEMPPRRLMYAEKPTNLQQKVWECEWNTDIASSMLYCARNAIDIPATLESMENYYLAIFCTACQFIWASGNRDRAQFVYPHIISVNDDFFYDRPGLDWLRLPVTARSG